MDTNLFNPQATQKHMVLRYMLDGGAITAVKAQSEFKVMRLAAIIHQIRRDGYRVAKEWKQSYSGRRYAEYRIAR